MTGDELKAWRTMVKLSQEAAATVLGYNRRHYQRMENGLDEIRDGVALGCAAYALGIRRYDGPALSAHIILSQKKKGTTP